MPNIYKIEDQVDEKLKATVLEHLRQNDEAILLPGAFRSEESMGFKNMVFRLDGEAKGIPADLMSSEWGHGISAVRITAQTAEAVLNNPEQRQRSLKRLVEAIPNELSERSVEIGPALLSEEHDAKDVAPWIAGFDSSSCCCGLYSAAERRDPDGCPVGTSRVHGVYYLVVKAGAGRAAQEFASRLSAASKSGESLDKAFSVTGSMGRDALGRLVTSGRRNRARIIAAASEALGVDVDVQSVADSSNHVDDNTRTAILLIDAHTNTLHPEQPTGMTFQGNTANPGVRRWIYHASSYDASTSQGAASCSSMADGIVVFTTVSGEHEVTVRNAAENSIPFGSKRVSKTQTVVAAAAESILVHAQKTGRMDSSNVHPDSEWLNNRFGWKQPTVRQRDPNFEAVAGLQPAHLWGTHTPVDWLSYSRELSIEALSPIRLHPEIVCVGGTEPSKLRAAARILAQRVV